jgi:hypothetical protein
MACLAGLIGGMISLSRVYTLTPYLLLGVGTVYLRFAAPAAPGVVPQFTQRLAVRWLALGGAFVAIADTFVRFLLG